MHASWKTAGANVSLCTMEREESCSNKPREGFVRIDFLAELCKQGPCVSTVRDACWCTSTEFEQLQRTIAPALRMRMSRETEGTVFVKEMNRVCYRETVHTASLA